MEVERLLKKPPQKYRDLVLWSVSGRFDAIGIKRQMECFSTMGYGGVCIKAGIGLKEDYNGEGWIEIIQVAVAEAKRLGLQVYICDDDAYAFGSNGGLATINPRFRAKKLVCSIMNGNEFSFADYKNEFISAYGVRIVKENGEERLGYYYTINNPAEVRKGDDVMVITACEQKGEDRYNGSYAPDLMSEDAFAYFLTLRLAKYKEVFYNEFGGTIKGIFSSDCMIDYSIKTVDGKRTRPYSEQLGNEFVNNYGYRLLPRLPEIFYPQAGTEFSSTALKYCATIKGMFEKNRLSQYANWCLENGLLFMGALGMDDEYNDGIVGNDRMRALNSYDIPAIYAHDLNTPLIKYVALASICRQNEKIAHSACFFNTDRSVTFSSYKNEIDVQAFFGIGRKIYCSAYSSIEEECKRNGNSFSYQMPSYKEFKTLTDYSARLNMLNSTSTALSSVLVVYGEESIDGKFNDVDERESLEDVCDVLIENDIDFDLVSEEKLAVAKEKGFGKKTKIVIGNCDYSTVIICGATTLRTSSVNLLTKYAKRGGNCVFAGLLPSRIDGNETDYKKLQLYAYSKVRKIDSSMLDGIEKPLSITVEDETSSVKVKLRKSAYGYYLFAINGHKDAKATAKVTVSGEFYPARFNLTDGAITKIDSERANKKTTFTLSIAPSGECAVGLFDDKINVEKDTDTAKISREKVEVPTMVDYRLSEFNTLVLDVASVTVDGQNLGKAEIVSCAGYLRKTYNLTQRGGIQPWYTERILKKDVKHKVADLRLSYVFNVQTKPLKMKLAMEKPELFEIYVNGRRLPMQKDGLYVDSALEKIVVPSTFIHEGRNEITLITALCDETPLEPLYLLGNFGVRIEKNEGDFDKYEIIELPQKLSFGDVCLQGLPFYSGKIYYYIPLPEGEYMFKFAKRNTWDYVKLRTKEDSSLVAFYPFEGKIKSGVAERDYERYESLGEVTIFQAPETQGVQLEVALTRKNTFGPLHEIVKQKKEGGVYKTVTEFSRSAVLQESGLGEIVVKKL